MQKNFLSKKFQPSFQESFQSNYVSQIILIFLAKKIFHLKIANIAHQSLKIGGFKGIQASK
jgi:hypothetical protein